MMFAFVGCVATEWMAPVTGLSGVTVDACPWIMGAGPWATQVAMRFSADRMVVVSSAAVPAGGSALGAGSAGEQATANNAAIKATRRLPSIRAPLLFSVADSVLM